MSLFVSINNALIGLAYYNYNIAIKINLKKHLILLGMVRMASSDGQWPATCIYIVGIIS